MAESYGGGFAGDRAGLMNLENVLGGVTQNAMANRLFAAQMGQQDFERQMQQKQLAMAQTQQDMQRRIMPWEVASSMMGFYATPQQRMQAFPELYKMIMGERYDPSKIAGDGDNGLPGTPEQPQAPQDTSFAGRHPYITGGLSLLGSGLGGLGGARIGHPYMGGVAGGAAVYSLLDNIGKQDPTGALNPTPTPTPMMGAMGLSPAPGAATKRAYRGMGLPSPKNSQ